MFTHSFTFGRVSLGLVMPEIVRSSMLSAYIRSFEGDLLPRLDCLIRLAPLAEAPSDAVTLSRRLGFHRAAFQRVGDEWRIFAHLPEGPTRPDTLPTRAVIPALFAVLVEAGVVPIHASAVLHQGRAIVIPGRSGSGKSTTADALVERGCGFFADDRLLAWMDGGVLRVTPSFELGNPFSRWVGRRPEEGRPPPPRRQPAFGRSAEIGALVFPEVRPGQPSSIDAVSAAEAHARLASSCAVDWSLALPSVPAHRLTLGDSPGTVMAQILST